MATAVAPKPGINTGQGPGGKGSRGNGGGPDGGGQKRPTSLDADKIGMWLAVGGITMLFAALTSAYVVRFGEAQASSDWGSFGLPRVLWLSSAVLGGSSFTFEFARR